MPSDIALIISALCLILMIPMLLICVAYYHHQHPHSDSDTDHIHPYIQAIGNISESEQVIKDK